MKESYFSKKALGSIARIIESEFSPSTIKRVLISVDIPKSVVSLKSKTILAIFMKCEATNNGVEILSHIIQEFLSPFNHDGDKEKARIFLERIRNILKLDSLHVFEKGYEYQIFNDSEAEHFINTDLSEDWYEILNFYEDEKEKFIQTKLAKSKDLNIQPPAETNNELDIVTSLVKIEGENGFLLLGDRKVKIGKSKNVTFKVLELLCPFGKEVSVDALYKKTSPTNSKKEGLSLEQKRDILKSRLKDLQKILNKEKIKVTLSFNAQTGTLKMINKTKK